MTTSNPYAQAIEKKKGALFIPFVVLGDPNYKQSLETIRCLLDSGADALELGIPFSDPPADGPVIQEADSRALASGTTVDDCFSMLREIRTFTDIPIGLLVYYNLVLQRGNEKFYSDCKKSGVDSVLIADLPLEHARGVSTVADAHTIAPVFMISELTTDERLKEITKIAKGYLYVVSYVGITGKNEGITTDKVRSLLLRARTHTDLPLFVGFGINTPSDATACMNAGVDGVIVGSAIVQRRNNLQAVHDFCCDMLKACNQ